MAVLLDPVAENALEEGGGGSRPARPTTFQHRCHQKKIKNTHGFFPQTWGGVASQKQLVKSRKKTFRFQKEQDA